MTGHVEESLRPADVWDPVEGAAPAADAMPSPREVHDRRYRDARARGWPGWGGPERIAGGEDFVGRMLLNGPAPASGRVLELGCGAGHLGRLLVAAGYRVAGVDFSPVAIAWATDEARAAGMDIGYAVIDLGAPHRSIGFPDGHDLVIDANCLHCIVDDAARRHFLANARAALALGGTFVVSARCARRGESIRTIDGVPARRFREPDLLVEEIESAGFHVAARTVRDRGEQVHLEL